MTAPSLRDLLHALLADPAAGEVVAQAREALAAHPLGAELQGVALSGDDVEADALALLAVLDEARDARVVQAFDARVGGADVADGVLAALFGPGSADLGSAVEAEAGRGHDHAVGFDSAALPVAAAVQAEAGPAPELATAFDGEALPLAEAVRAAAGAVDVVAAVLAEVAQPDALPEGWTSGLLDAALDEGARVRAAARLAQDPSARAELGAMAEVGRVLREAVRGEAGAVPAAWEAVAASIGAEVEPRVEGWDETLVAAAVRAEAGPVEVADRVLAAVRRGAAAPVPLELPEPANRATWAGLTFVLAAAAGFVVVLLLPQIWLSGRPADPWTPKPASEFATADELTVDRVQYGENASVFVEVPEERGAPVLIWVDDGADL